MTKNKVIKTVCMLICMLLAISVLFVGCQSECEKNGHKWNASGVCTVCGEKDTSQEYPMADIPETTDNYRTYYQIFPYAFADSDGNGIGDLQGIIDKLDYIADMNFDGIWLTPVHRSRTYHKYDVMDYKSIEGTFGTLEDYDRLVEECHQRGMTVLMDLVINHTSAEHEWFRNCVDAHKVNRPYDQYYNYYNLRQGSPGGVWYQSDAKGWVYEGQFWDQMPDLNWDEVLQHPDGALANDLREVMRFWLEDHNVDGFRLDAVSQFFTGNTARNIECLKWINETAKSIKPDCYIVGEGPWDRSAYNYYNSGIDSLFLFNHGYQAGNSIAMAARLGDVKDFTNIDKTNKASIPTDGMPAMIISNHDISRAYKILGGAAENGLDNMKLGFGVMQMCAGSTFVYYGDEVGMNNAGSKDEDKRQPMPWGDSYTCRPVGGSTAADDSEKYPFGTVEENLADSNSLVAYITRANALRRAFPAIARNYNEVVYVDDVMSCLALIKKGDGDGAVYIAVNLSHDTEMSLDMSQFGTFELCGTLSVNIEQMPVLNGSALQMPAMTFAVLRKV